MLGIVKVENAKSLDVQELKDSIGTWQNPITKSRTLENASISKLRNLFLKKTTFVFLSIHFKKELY